MIVDTIEHRALYIPKESGLRSGMDFILSHKDTAIEAGRYEIDGDKAYAMVHNYTTAPAPERKLESHRRYIDIQYILSGTELIEWALIASLEARAPYSDNEDVIFYRDCDRATSLILEAGMFVVFYPSDAHKPGCSAGKPQFVRKIVVKMAV